VLWQGIKAVTVFAAKHTSWSTVDCRCRLQVHPELETTGAGMVCSSWQAVGRPVCMISARLGGPASPQALWPQALWWHNGEEHPHYLKVMSQTTASEPGCAVTARCLTCYLAGGLL